MEAALTADVQHDLKHDPHRHVIQQEIPHQQIPDGGHLSGKSQDGEYLTDQPQSGNRRNKPHIEV